MARTRLATLALGLALLGSQPTAAQTTAPPADDATAERLVRAGLELRRAGDDAGALALFERADAAAPSGRTRAQVALAEQALGRWVEAEVHLREALALGGAWVAANEGALARALEVIRDRLGDLEVHVDVAGAEVRVGGRLVGRAPLAGPVRVVAGTAALHVRAPGRPPVSRAVEVPARGLARERVVLGPPTEVRVDGPAPAPPVRPGEAEGPGGPWRPLAWSAVGVGAAGLVTAAVAYGVRESAARSFNDAACAPTPTSTRGENCPDERARVDRAERAITAGLVVAGVGLLGAVALFLAAAGAQDDGEPSAAVVCGAGPGEIGVACTGWLR